MHYGLSVSDSVSFLSLDISDENQKKAQTGEIIIAFTSENVEDVCGCCLGRNTPVCVSGHTAILSTRFQPIICCILSPYRSLPKTKT